MTVKYKLDKKCQEFSTYLLLLWKRVDIISKEEKKKK